MEQTIQCSFERYEKKYFLTPAKHEYLLQKMKPYLKEDLYSHYSICNLYYDTDNWQLIRTSIEKPVYKEKLRVRSYGIPKENENVFIELKKKYDGIVYKRRITTEAVLSGPFLDNSFLLDFLVGSFSNGTSVNSTSSDSTLSGDTVTESSFGQIGREICWFQNQYHTKPKVFIGYNRLAFTGISDTNLRITFDSNMRWRDSDLNLCLGDDGQPLLSDDRILMEIKMPGACPLWLSRLLSEEEIFPVSFSKYGTCYQEHILKKQKKQTTKEAYRCA